MLAGYESGALERVGENWRLEAGRPPHRTGIERVEWRRLGQSLFASGSIMNGHVRSDDFSQNQGLEGR
jgi:hypothetical protein